jgi:hypothetical protein
MIIVIVIIIILIIIIIPNGIKFQRLESKIRASEGLQYITVRNVKVLLIINSIY